MAKNIGLLCRARKILAIPTLVMLYNTFIHPYLIYCIEIWGSANESSLCLLLRIQKKAIRIISSVHPEVHTEMLFTKYNILNVYRLFQYMLAVFMFKHHRKKLPQVCSNLFTSNEEIHNYNTRQKTWLHVPVSTSTAHMKTVRFMGVKLWNKLSSKNIELKCSIFTFKRHLKKHLMIKSLLSPVQVKVSFISHVIRCLSIERQILLCILYYWGALYTALAYSAGLDSP